MTTLNVTTARIKLADITDAAEHHGQRTILSRHGKPAAAVVPIEDLELLREIEDAYDLELARKARAEPGERITHEQLGVELGIK